MNFAAFIQDCESKIRAGEGAKVARRFGELGTLKIPRQFRLPLANICRRTGQFTRGLTLLTPIVSPQRHLAEPATPLELAEYGVLLLRCGALHEAQQVLHSVNRTEAPEADLYEAFCRLTNWEAQEAIPLLQSYLKADISPYARMVGTTNLGIALVQAERNAEALAVLGPAIVRTEETGSVSLESNCLALRAQVYLRESKFSNARGDLEKAHALFGTSKTNDQFRVTKWLKILQALESGKVEPLLELQPMAAGNFDWETLREVDLYRSKLKFDAERFLHLVFGTPFPKFRERIFREVAKDPQREIFVLGDKRSPRFDLAEGKLGETEILTPGSMPHQLLNVLLRDFYRPLRIGGLFAELFPDEHFNIFSSPDRVHQLLRRTRRWCEDTSLALEIQTNNGFYSLKMGAGLSIRCRFERGQIDSLSLRWKKLNSVYSTHDIFSASDAREKLGMSKRTLQQLLSWAVDNGKVERLGSTSISAQYKIAG